MGYFLAGSFELVNDSRQQAFALLNCLSHDRELLILQMGLLHEENLLLSLEIFELHLQQTQLLLVGFKVCWSAGWEQLTSTDELAMGLFLVVDVSRHLLKLC